MNYATPLKLITSLVDARSNADIETAILCYEPDATLIPQPSGVVVRGLPAIREFLTFFVGLRPTFEVLARSIIEANGIALHFSHYRLRGTSPAGEPMDVTGRTTDVFRQQPDGNWLIAIDNPYGVSVLDQPEAQVNPTRAHE